MQPSGPPQPMQPPGSGMPGALGKLPASAPGTIFGIPVARMHEPALQRKALLFLGIALVASIVVPVSLSPFRFQFQDGGSFFHGLLWPAIAGAAYLLVAAAPPDIRKQVPPIVLQWLPFGVSFASIGLISSAMGGGGGMGAVGFNIFYWLGYATLLFGLLSRIQDPNDQIARIIIAVGSGQLVFSWLNMLDWVGHFSPFFILHLVLHLTFLVTLLGIACALFIVPANKLPPALQALDNFAPMLAALFLVWIPGQFLLIWIAMVIHGQSGGIVNSILELLHILLPIAAYFGVLLMTAPAAFKAVMDIIKKEQQGQGQPPQQPPPMQQPPGGGYPPQQGGWPQQ